jgi:hypothetical protein
MMRKILYLILLLIIGGAIFISLSRGPQHRDNYSNAYTVSAVELEMNRSKMISKPIFDATDYLNKNPLNRKIFLPIRNIYWFDLLKDKNFIIIDTVYLTKLALSLPKTNLPYILDIETWDVHTRNDEEANKNIDKYILVIDTMKKARPDLKFGFYGVLPNRDYWTPIHNKVDEIREWEHINQRLKRLAEHVDVICPSLYTFEANRDHWKTYALENIKRARAYGKPVYPFLWPQYHEGGNVKPIRKFIELDFWKLQLSLVYQEADGVIVWGGYGDNTTLQWDENAPWWQYTKSFIEMSK